MKLAPLNTVPNTHDDFVRTTAWVPTPHDSSPLLLLTGSLDETVRLWNPEGPEKIQTNTGYCLGVVFVTAHHSGRIAASSSIDRFIRVFDAATNNTIATFEAPPCEVWQLQFNPQGTTLGAAGGGSASVKLFSTSEWRLIATLAVPRLEGGKPTEKKWQQEVCPLSCIESLRQQIACGSMDDTISIFDVSRAKFLHHLEGHCMHIRSLVYSSAPLDSTLAQMMVTCMFMMMKGKRYSLPCRITLAGFSP